MTVIYSGDEPSHPGGRQMQSHAIADRHQTYRQPGTLLLPLLSSLRVPWPRASQTNPAPSSCLRRLRTATELITDHHLITHCERSTLPPQPSTSTLRIHRLSSPSPTRLCPSLTSSDTTLPCTPSPRLYIAPSARLACTAPSTRPPSFWLPLA